MNQLDIDKAISDIRAGNTEAYAALVAAYQQDVWKVAAAMLRDYAATENLVQQTFVNAFFKLDQFHAGADFGVWIKAIARNAVREELRKRSTSDEHLRHYHDLLAARLNEDASPPDPRVEALRNCRKRLAPLAARAVELRYEKGRPFDEIARELNRTIDATRQLLNRIRLTLRDCMERKASNA